MGDLGVALLLLGVVGRVTGRGDGVGALLRGLGELLPRLRLGVGRERTRVAA